MTTKRIAQIEQGLLFTPKKWLVTGCAGFIGSHLVEKLLTLGQTVVGLDNFSTGYEHNLNDIKGSVGTRNWANFSLVRGDIRDLEECKRSMVGVDHVLHQAALGSVPRSVADPLTTNDVNVTGFLNVLVAAASHKVKSVVYAASSSTYGDHPALPKVEDTIGSPLSPYAVTKYVNELYANVFLRCYGLRTVGLRYFNVFGERQDPNGPYSAVIPRWISAMINDEAVTVNGDGLTSRDFCYVKNVVQANLLAALADDPALDEVYNIAVGDITTLNSLFDTLRAELAGQGVIYNREMLHGPSRAGDVRHSQADISKASVLLGYTPEFRASDGLRETVSWFVGRAKNEPSLS